MKKMSVQDASHHIYIKLTKPMKDTKGRKKNKVIEELKEISKQIGINPDDWVVDDLETWEAWAEKYKSK